MKDTHSSPIKVGYGAVFVIFVIQILIYILLHSLQWCIQYHVILDHVITVPDCIVISGPKVSYIQVQGWF